MNKKPMKFDSNGIAASNSFLSSIALEVLEAERQERACRRACSDADFDNATYGTWNISDRDWFTNLTFLIMTFETALLSSGYVYDAQPGVYMKEEQNGVLHTYMQIDGDVWNYEKYDADDKVLMTKEFTLWSYFA